MASTISEELKQQILDKLLNGERQVDIARKLSTKKTIVNYYSRHLKDSARMAKMTGYFNADAYFKEVQTI